MDLYWLDKSESHTFFSAWKHHMVQNSFRMVGYFRKLRLDRICRDVKSAQENVLKDILRLNEDTLYGRDFQLKKVKSREQFVKQHPITNYSHFEDYINRAANGEENVVTVRPIKRFGRTSGTTGKSKLIPMTRDTYTTIFLDGFATATYQLYSTFPDLRNLQKGLALHFSTVPQQTASGVPVGPASGLSKTSSIFLLLYTTPSAAYDILTEPEAMYIYILFALKESLLGAIESNFASMIYVMFKTLEAKWPQLVEDIRTGTIDSKLQIPEDVLDELEQLLQPDEKRANELQEIFQSGFDSVALKIWPKLKVIFTSTTGSMEVYGRILKSRYCKGVLHYPMLYAATEGLFGINIWPEKDDTRYLLIPNALFLEFIPEEECDKPNPQTKFMDQLVLNECYEIVVTNYCGLYRYRMGDVVRVIDFHRSAPVIQFMHRNGQLLNISGEKFAESLFYTGLKLSIDQWKNAVLVDYTCIESILLEEELHLKPVESSASYYMVFIELLWEDGQDRQLDPLEKQLLDLNLQEVHLGYRRLRSTESIGSAQIIQVLPGTFCQLRQFLIDNSSVTGNQLKIPRVLRNVQAVQLLLNNDVLKQLEQ